MIDPVIVSFELFGITIAIRWYGVLVMAAVLVGTWITERQIRQRGGDPEIVTDALPIALVSGVVGARLWYVLNATMGGNRYFIDNPAKILAIPEGGLHIYGAFLLGGLAVVLYLRHREVDFRLLLDSVAPGMLIGQAVARPANFINQELYGPPTTLPWGIPIDAAHRLSPWDDLIHFPVETTRFHPTFAYEIAWNLLAGGLLVWVSKRYGKRILPGSIFAGWMILGGIGRFLIEAFRPDQPRLPGTDLSYSRLVAGFLALAGLVWLLARYGYIRIPWIARNPSQYQTSSRKGNPAVMIVSGLPRSGTSMMMRILEAGGIPIIADQRRGADDDNPEGYYELERVKRLPHGDLDWLANAPGKAVKVISALLEYLPSSYNYRVIFMQRPMEEILASQREMLIHNGKDPDVADEAAMAENYEVHLQRIKAWLSTQKNFSVIYVSYTDVVKSPGPALQRIRSFLEEEVGVALDASAMQQVVNPSLYRQRSN